MALLLNAVYIFFANIDKVFKPAPPAPTPSQGINITVVLDSKESEISKLKDIIKKLEESALEYQENLNIKEAIILSLTNSTKPRKLLGPAPASGPTPAPPAVVIVAKHLSIYEEQLLYEKELMIAISLSLRS